jgi:phage recombination protein Bet
MEESIVNAVVKAGPPASNSVIVRMAQRFGVDPDKMLGTLKATAFKGDVSTEQMMALAVVADQYGLNPWTKEIYAFPDKHNGIVPVVGVDGWSRIINSNPQFDGMDFEEGPLNAQRVPEWIECRMHRKDRGHPICVKEYLDEVYREPFTTRDGKKIDTPWQSHPRRMLRHKAMIQCARLAFGFVGIYDEDEAERIREVIDVTPAKIDPRGDLTAVDYSLRDEHVAEIKRILDQDKEEHVIAEEVREYVHEALMPFQELFITVNDKLAADKIISKAAFRKMYSGEHQRPEGR